jgi:hypothetical protein
VRKTEKLKKSKVLRKFIDFLRKINKKNLCDFFTFTNPNNCSDYEKNIFSSFRTLIFVKSLVLCKFYFSNKLKIFMKNKNWIWNFYCRSFVFFVRKSTSSNWSHERKPFYRKYTRTKAVYLAVHFIEKRLIGLILIGNHLIKSNDFLQENNISIFSKPFVQIKRCLSQSGSMIRLSFMFRFRTNSFRWSGFWRGNCF